DQSELREGRKVRFEPRIEFCAHKSADVVIFCSEERGMIRSSGLDEHLSGSVMATRAACDLHEELKGSLSGAKVRHAESSVGVQDTDQRHARKIMPFGDHLRPHQNIDFTLPHPVEYGTALGPACDVAVQSSDARRGK